MIFRKKNSENDPGKREKKLLIVIFFSTHHNVFYLVIMNSYYSKNICFVIDKCFGNVQGPRDLNNYTVGNRIEPWKNNQAQKMKTNNNCHQ